MGREAATVTRLANKRERENSLRRRDSEGLKVRKGGSGNSRSGTLVKPGT